MKFLERDSKFKRLFEEVETLVPFDRFGLERAMVQRQDLQRDVIVGVKSGRKLLQVDCVDSGHESGPGRE